MISLLKKYFLSSKYLFFIILSASFLRFFRLNELMPFIGDQGWFYLSARDLILNGKFPLVGITASHTWLHQGALWTYILSFILWIFKFNPLAPAYFTSLVDVLTVFITYKVFGELFSKRIGIIVSLLYAFSPIIIIHSRIPYHTNLIPLFIILFIYFLSKWVKGSLQSFSLLILILSILYNLELATVAIWFIFIAFFIYGFYKKKKWTTQLLNKKIIFSSFFFFILVMFPVFVYDLQNGFPQTVKFALWFPYRFFKIFSQDFQQNFGIWNFFLSFINKIIFLPSAVVALFIFFLSFVTLFLTSLKSKNKNYKTLFLVILVPLLVFLINKTPSEAYLPILFPQVILMVAVLFDELIRIKKTWFVISSLIAIVSLNTYSLLSKNYLMNRGYGLTFRERLNASKDIINKSGDEEYNLIGRGEGSQFESFTMNYKYLTWYLGNPPSSKKENIKIEVYEKNNLINVTRMVNKE